MDDPLLRLVKKSVRTSAQRRVQRLRLHAQRLDIAERLAHARPDLVVPTYETKRAILTAREAKAQEKAQAREMERKKVKMEAHFEATGMLLSFETAGDDDGGMDWDRSRALREAVKTDIANSRRPTLPLLTCTESQ
jgi:hypothetical protein